MKITPHVDVTYECDACRGTITTVHAELQLSQRVLKHGGVPVDYLPTHMDLCATCAVAVRDVLRDIQVRAAEARRQRLERAFA